jgi:hypothetical protein
MASGDDQDNCMFNLVISEILKSSKPLKPKDGNYDIFNEADKKDKLDSE